MTTRQGQPGQTGSTLRQPDVRQAVHSPFVCNAVQLTTVPTTTGHGNATVYPLPAPPRHCLLLVRRVTDCGRAGHRAPPARPIPGSGHHATPVTVSRATVVNYASWWACYMPPPPLPMPSALICLTMLRQYYRHLTARFPRILSVDANC